MTGILNAGSLIVSPYPSSGMTVTVSQVTTDANGSGKIAWSDASGGTAYTVGSTVQLPTAMRIANISVIWCHVTYPYQPSVGPALIGSITFTRDAYFFPRLSPSVARANS